MALVDTPAVRIKLTNAKDLTTLSTLEMLNLYGLTTRRLIPPLYDDRPRAIAIVPAFYTQHSSTFHPSQPL
jgi:hypothetical protein